MRYAEKTQVSTAGSKAEIESLLQKYGATGFMNGWKNDSAMVCFEMNGRAIRFILPLPKVSDDEFARNGRGTRMNLEQRTARWEQACRQKWRALVLTVKAKLEAVESGITTFEHEFLAHFVTANGQTIGDIVIPELDQARLTGPMVLLDQGQRPEISYNPNPF